MFEGLVINHTQDIVSQHSFVMNRVCMCTLEKQVQLEVILTVNAIILLHSSHSSPAREIGLFKCLDK